MRISWRESAGFWSILAGHASAFAVGSNGILEPRNDAGVVVAGVSEYWEGNDGRWSSFVLQVGNRSQEVRVLPSTASPSTWVVYENLGCNNIPISDCPTSRGKTFQPNSSQTWVWNLQGTIFNLGVEENLLGRQVFGEFGYDSMTLGYTGGGGPTVQRSVIAGIADTHFTWLGALGLNPRPVNFTSMPGASQPSLVQTLKNQGDIKSLSWAYTAGAHYKSPPVFGSLVFGGYDRARFNIPRETDQSLTFPFYTDVERDLLVGIWSIETSNTTKSTSPTRLLTDGIFALIDSTVPHIWLPEKVCAQFEAAFGLQWDNETELYKVSESQHNTLLALNPSITLNISPTLDASAVNKSVAITLPYSSFDLEVDWPFGDGPYKNETARYFPLKRAANASQYTLGRTFLQEAYVIADYERQNFSVWPCKWDDAARQQRLVPISLSNDTAATTTTTTKGAKLRTGAIVGIAVGGLAVLVIFSLAIWLYCRRRSRAHTADPTVERAESNTPHLTSPELSPHANKTASVAEIGGTMKHELHEDHRFEVEPGGKFEMDGEGLPHEADSRERGGLFEMDAGGDGIGLVDSHGALVRITVEPPTAVTPRPRSMLPSPVSTQNEEASTVGGSDMDKFGSSNTTRERILEPTRSDRQEVDEKDGVRSFFGFLKAFRASGKT